MLILKGKIWIEFHEVWLLHKSNLKPESLMIKWQEKKKIDQDAKLTTSIIITNATNIQIKLLVKDIQQLKGEKGEKRQK